MRYPRPDLGSSGAEKLFRNSIFTLQKTLHFLYKEQLFFAGFRKRAELVFVVVGHKLLTGRLLFKISRENSNHMTKS
jgi:hypothetical protein